MLNIIALMIALDLLHAPQNPLSVISAFQPAQFQLRLFHQLYLTVDTLSAAESARLQAVLASFQPQILETLLSTSSPEAFLVVSDAIAYSSTFPPVFIDRLLATTLHALSTQTFVDDALDLFMNVMIRGLSPSPVTSPLRINVTHSRSHRPAAAA